MIFRADDAARIRLESTERFLLRNLHDLDATERQKSEDMIATLVEELGPVVDGYPIWHPLLSRQPFGAYNGWPGPEAGYNGLDHVVAFRDGFLACPYTASGKVEKILQSVEALPPHDLATIRAEILDVTLYHPDTTTVLVRCDWHFEPENGVIPMAYAIPLMLNRVLGFWREKEQGRSWEYMRTYLLGQPHGSRSSLFVGQDTGQAMKKLWQQLVDSGMFGQE